MNLEIKQKRNEGQTNGAKKEVPHFLLKNKLNFGDTKFNTLISQNHKRYPSTGHANR